MIKLVEQMLELHKRQAARKSQSDHDLYQRQIARPVPAERGAARPAVSGVDATDREIDKLVYELYGLTEKEIAVVEEKR